MATARPGTTARGRLTAAAICALLVAGALVAGCATSIPSVVGLDVEGAGARLRDAGLTVGAVRYDPGSAAPTWTVVAQSAAGETSRGASIDLVVAGGRPVTVPDLAREATAGAETTAVTVAYLPASFSDTVPARSVVSQDPPAGAVVPEGTIVRVTLSKGPQPPASSGTTLRLVKRITGDLSPKSIVSTGRGLVFAQNMIYRHTISVFDESTRKLVRTIPDNVRLSRFGYPQYDEPVRGGPVEAAATPDGRYVYVSNYSMYGPGFSHPGDDKGGPGSGVDRSFVYRVDTGSLRIDRAIRVGAVPKYLAVTPDGRYVLVANWISYTLSVIDTASDTQLREIRIGPYPRGIAVSPDSKWAYIAVMGSTSIARVDLTDFSVHWIRGVGLSPRHLVLSPDGGYLYATLNGSGRVVKISLSSRKVVDSVATGREPRSMAISADGGSLYVVNYESNTVSKVRTSDMKVMQSVKVDTHPIGITYVASTAEVWVACYRGSILVFADR